MKKILITGAGGMLGHDFYNTVKGDYEIIQTNHNQLDITNFNKTYELIKEIKPDTVVNCAAYTNVDACETNIEEAYKVNAIGPKNLAIACNEVNAPLLHISTDYVFDGQSQKPYKEDDIPNPINIYGKSKLAGENNIKNHMNKFYIIRTQWLYGINGNNFAKTMLNLFKDKKEVKVVDDQFGSPTATKDLADLMAKLIKNNQYGLYHGTNEGIVTWFDFASKILEISNIKGINLQPCTTKEFPRPAARPKYSPLNNFNLKLIGEQTLENYEKPLKEYINKIL